MEKIKQKVRAELCLRIAAYADQLGRELTDEELSCILSADALANRNWHNLSSTDAVLCQLLERQGYLTGGGQGFTGGARLPDTKRIRAGWDPGKGSGFTGEPMGLYALDSSTGSLRRIGDPPPPSAEELLVKWLGSVNQPVVRDIQSTVRQLLVTVSDHGNYDHSECQRILAEVVMQAPESP